MIMRKKAVGGQWNLVKVNFKLQNTHEIKKKNSPYLLFSNNPLLFSYFLLPA